jgi:hypothetical protein
MKEDELSASNCSVSSDDLDFIPGGGINPKRKSYRNFKVNKSINPKIYVSK